MKSTQYLIIVILILIVLLIPGCSTIVDNDVKANNGLLDLAQWDFEKDGNIKLDGQWEFYWNKLLIDQDLKNEKPTLYGEVPRVWNMYKLDGSQLPGEGYATYKLHVKTDLDAGTMLGLRTYLFSSAYALYINEKFVAFNGSVGTAASEENAGCQPQAVFFAIPDSEFDIIIQVSNFHYARGGFWYSVYMGTADHIQNLHDSLMGKAVFLFGTLTIAALFNFALYILRRELKYTLYFALLCTFLLVGQDMVGQFILPRIFPVLNNNAIIFLWYSSTNWVQYFLIRFMHEFFPSKFSRIVHKVFLVICVLWQMFFIFTPPTFYTRFGHLSDYIEMISFLCTIIIVAIGIKKGRKDGWLNIMCLGIFLSTYMHDVLYWMKVVKSNYVGEIFYIGIFVFVLTQMIIQAQRTKSYYDNKIAAETAFLQAQIKPHFLYNTLNTIQSISRYDVEKSRNLLIKLSQYLRRSFDFKDLSYYVPLKNEIELAKAYVEIEKARFEERLEVNFDLPEDLEVRVPMLVLQPLIENAVIHGILPKPEGGRIDISIKREAQSLVFKIIDNGVGMTDARIHEILNDEKVKGVGIFNINNRLRKFYGKGLKIKSKPGTGTEIIWLIPLKDKRRDDNA